MSDHCAGCGAAIPRGRGHRTMHGDREILMCRERACVPADFGMPPGALDAVARLMAARDARTPYFPPPLPLLDRDPTPEDLEAERDPPRPGVWAGEPGADLRALTQDETDALIRFELWWNATWGSPATVDPATTVGEVAQLLQALGFAGDAIPQLVSLGRTSIARCQRGGIDSDPLVRVLARRAWGDRDRQWFELRGVRKGDKLTPRLGGVSVAWPGEFVLVGAAEADARPGEMARTRFGNGLYSEPGRVSDRLREPPVYDDVQRPIRTNHVSLGPVDPTRPEQRLFADDDLAKALAAAITGMPPAWGDMPWPMPEGAGTPSPEQLIRYWPVARQLDLRTDPEAAARELARTTPLAYREALGLVQQYRAMMGGPVDPDFRRCRCGAPLVAGACSDISCWAEQPRR